MELICVALGVIIGFFIARIYQRSMILDIVSILSDLQEKEDDANWWKTGRNYDEE